MGRPKLDCHVERISLRLSLRVGVDDDLIQFFNEIPRKKRASAVKAGLRSGGIELVAGNGEQFDDQEEAALLNALDDMEW